MNAQHPAACWLLVLVVGALAACDRRDDPAVDGGSKGVSSPPGEIVDPGTEASAQADRMPRHRTPDRPACQSGEAVCDRKEAAPNDAMRERAVPDASERDD